jgi:hypothetical protein
MYKKDIKEKPTQPRKVFTTSIAIFTHIVAVVIIVVLERKEEEEKWVGTLVLLSLALFGGFFGSQRVGEKKMFLCCVMSVVVEGDGFSRTKDVRQTAYPKTHTQPPIIISTEKRERVDANQHHSSHSTHSLLELQHNCPHW